MSTTPTDDFREALLRFRTAVLQSSKEGRSFVELVGHSGPAVDRLDIVRFVQDFHDRIESSAAGVDWESEKNGEASAFFQSFAKRTDQMTAVAVPQLWNGNGGSASASVLLTLLTMHRISASLLQWPEAHNEYSIPHKLLRRIKAADIRVQDVEEQCEGLSGKLDTILRAHEAAETFPTDLEELQRVRHQIDSIAESSIAIQARLEEIRTTAAQHMVNLNGQQAEAAAIVEKCKAAYRNATSTGLAGAFQEKAWYLNITIAGWTAGLVIALGLGAWLGGNRIATLSTLVSTGATTGAIVMQLALSILSIGAPVWFAWLATTQIGQRFRLAEDYAFKASVSKAYEGYRSEAESLNSEVFSMRLFAAALDRLEEPPIRLLEKSSVYSSPIQELLNSPVFEKAFETMPALRAKLAELGGIKSRTVAVKPTIPTSGETDA